MDWLTFTILLIALVVVASTVATSVNAWKEVRLADAKALLANAMGPADEDEPMGDVVEVPEPLKAPRLQLVPVIVEPTDGHSH